MSMTASIDITISGHKYVLRGEGDKEHLREVAELVKRRVESIQKRNPNLSLSKVAMLAAFDIASDSIKGKRKAIDFKKELTSKAMQLLTRVEAQLESTP